MGKSANLVFLKLGGSLITDKSQPHTARPETLARLAGEIAAARAENPDLQLLLGHGSGSFGHIPAKQYGTRQGVHTPDEWRGFAEVWREANALNRLVMDALLAEGLPAITFPPSAAVTARNGQVDHWDLTPMRSALAAGLLPVVFGDVVFDTTRGGTILSTEDLFVHLARQLQPGRILLAGIEAGVWAYSPRSPHSRQQYTSNTQSAQRREWGEETEIIIPQITPADWEAIAPALGGSANTDVTGGMASKVQEMLALIEEQPSMKAMIFSGKTGGNVQRALAGEQIGTVICQCPANNSPTRG